MAKLFSFSGVLWTDRTKFYPEPQTFANLYPSVTPFLSAAQARYNPSSNKLDAPDFKFFEYRAGWRYQYLDYNDATPATWAVAGAPNDTLSGTLTVDNATGITVDSSLIGAVLEVWDSTLATYKGQMLVTAVTNSTTITCKSAGNPGSATQATAALADNDRFFVITTAHGEETTAPEASSDEMEVVWNSCMLTRTSVEIGQTLANASLRGQESELARLRDTKANEHKIKNARGFYFGHRPGGIGGVAHGAGGGTDSTFVSHLTDANSKTVRTTMGLFSGLRRYGRTSGDQQNVFSHNMANMTYNDFVDFSEKAFQYSPSGGEKDLYAGPGAVSFFAKIGAEGLVTKTNGSRMTLSMSEPEKNRIGVRFQYIDTPHGTFRLVKDPLLRGTPYSNHALIVDPDNAQLVTYEPDTYHTNIKTDDNPRLIKDEFSSFSGIKMTLMESHSWLKLS